MNVNHLIISGNLTRDPEMRSVGADKTVTSFTVANNSKYKASDGEQREEVSFLDVETWGRQGEVAAQFLVKGSMVIVEGRIKQDNWTDKEGQKRSKLKLVADRVHLPPRGAREDGGGESTPTARAPAIPRPAAIGGGTSADQEPPFMRDEWIGA